MLSLVCHFYNLLLIITFCDYFVQIPRLIMGVLKQLTVANDNA